MESMSQSKIFLPSKDISEIYDLINLLRTNPKEYLTSYIIPNASSYQTPKLSYLISSLKNRPSIPPLHHNCPLQSLASEYLKYLVLTDQTEQTNPRYSYQKRLHTLGLQPCQYKELIIPYTSPISSINEMILNQSFKEHLFNPYMEHIGLAIDTLPNDDCCLMVNLAGAGCSTLIKSSSLGSFIPHEGGFMGEDERSVTASLIPGDTHHILTTHNTMNNNNRISTQGGEQGKLENMIANTEPSKIEQDEVVYDFDMKTKNVENNNNNNTTLTQKSYIDLNRTFPMKPGVDPNKMVQEDFVQGYNVYVVTKHYKKPFNSDRKWLKDFNRGMLGYCGGNVNLGNRESYSQYY